MRELLKMVVVLTVLTAVSGGLLAGLRAKTQDRIELQVLQFVKGPVLEELFNNAENNVIDDRFEVTYEEETITFFPIKIGGTFKYIVFSATGRGYGGEFGIMVGVDAESGKIAGVRITTHSETPGLGARLQTNPEILMPAFEGLDISQKFDVKTAGGQIDAVSGATETSRGVCIGVTEAGRIFSQQQQQIRDQLKQL